jgi:type VI secretion system protein ImpA
MEKILQPISEDDKCGQYLKYEYVYDQIREHRREDDPQLTQGIWQTEPKKANWEEVKAICEDMLINRSKDLQVAIWLLEALCEMHGFSGLNHGLLALHALCEKFWDEIHPQQSSESSVATRMAPLYFFAEKFPERILRIPLTAPSNGIDGTFRLADWITVRHNIHTKNTKGLGLKELAKSVAASPLQFFQQLEIDCANAHENLKKFDELLNNIQKNDSPSFNVFYNQFDDIKRINAKNLRDKMALQQAEEEKKRVIHEKKHIHTPEGMDILDVTAIENTAQPREATVEQAYEALHDIAIFLEQKQPQSPASMLLKIVSAIGKKTFQELMEVNMQNGATVISTISDLYKILKMPPDGGAGVPFQLPKPPPM